MKTKARSLPSQRAGENRNMDTQFAMKLGEAWLLSEVTLGLVRAQHTPAQHCLDAPVNRRGCAAVRNPILQIRKPRPGEVQ